MPHLLILSANRHTSPYPVYPLALSYLKSYLQQAWPELTISLMDLNLESDQQWPQRLAALAPDYVAVSLRNVDDVDWQKQRGFIEDYRQIIERVRTVSPAPVILGGAGYSLFPERLLGDLGGDYGLVGEGEESLLELLQTLQSGQDPAGMEGLVWRSAEGIRYRPRQRHVSAPKLSFEPELMAHYWRHSGMLNIQTKRGCPHRCVYCSYPLIDGRQVRTLQVPQIVQTLTEAWDKHGIDYVFFTDSVFNLEPAFNDELARALIKAGLPTKWGAYFAPHRLSSEQLALYQKAGLTHLEFGTEALSDITLASYNKPFRFKHVLRTAERAAELGIHQAHFLIMGGWGETRQSLTETLDNAEQLPDTVLFPYYGMRVYPDTELARQMVEAGKLAPEQDLLKPFYFLSPEFDLDWLKQQIPGRQQRWALPDEDFSDGIAMLRKAGKSGPLWEYI
ncbi:lipid biosynthesis B12-binding/radical SAM protein [Ferrimonas balearica]|uniref:lipid biosynthesis B12-binding/radical SAM protein n=1 Tax=Ferrimonas balearica TaxID=44012 RepID=UPI001C55F5F6|nr:radical SAM protein [Ferrimonas balearica]